MAGISAQAATAKIIKVLPHYLDLQGHHALSPSLYERDAYQSILRAAPEKCSGLRFDVQWKARLVTTNLLMRVEIRAARVNPLQPFTLERYVKPRSWGSRWTSLLVAGEDFRKLGSLIAWRVTLWDGDTLMAEQKSFLW